MLVPAIVFLIVLGVVFGVFYTAILRPEDARRDAVHARLQQQLGKGGRAPRKRASSLLRGDRDLTALPLVDNLLLPFTIITRPLGEHIAHANLQLTVGALLATSSIASVLAFVVVEVLTGYELVALGVAAVAFYVPIVVVRFKATRRIRAFEEQFPESVDLIARALRAGHAFTTALSMAADESPEPVGGEFKRLYDEQNFGMPLSDAMRDFARRIPLLDAKFFVTAVLTQRESGGNLAEVLDNLATVVRERFKVKRQVRVISAHGRMTGYVLMGLPPALAMAFMVVSESHIEMLLGDIIGLWMIAGAVVLQTMGCLIIRKLVNIEY
ncbi:Flp pilus assembly protein TadB [Luteitalea pratensis]|uniref:Flp pilus assembly protein TadB n=1 Tax=Luteitalea pratensis TaxID=1855912 RepID=A0A143PW51_LUTPR|nr:type II secretion system F family protein [Luteitalea pratensis]AMY12270.1 Flp pilus assembly protein TadB [Luteitalea pratensis]